MPKAVVLTLHGALLRAHGGARGLRDEGLLDSALAAPKNRFAYDNADVFQLAASYAYALSRNHPFHDGNKRVALTLAGLFLALNGYRLDAPEAEAATAFWALGAGELDEAFLAIWFRNSSRRIPTGGTTQAGSLASAGSSADP